MSEEKQNLKVGLVMPIAPIDGLSADHWLEIKKIITDALDENGTYIFETKIVSEGDSVGLIHKRIVQGLYTNDIVICDVSCKNPNVMFELGMRLAFDKPTIIIKDDKTNFTFDAGVIEHLEYPRDLRFTRVLEFKDQLAKKVIATYIDSQNDPEHSPFLKSYGPFTSVNIKSTEISEQAMIIEMLTEMQSDIHTLRMNAKKQSNYQSIYAKNDEMIRSLISAHIDQCYAERKAGSFTGKDILDTIDHFKLNISSKSISPIRLEQIVEEEFIKHSKF